MPKAIRHLLDLLFQRHRRELVSFAEQRGAVADAEDLVQEAFLKLLEQRQPKPIDNHRAYLFKTTANLVVSHHRWQEVRRKHHDESDIDVDALPSDEVDMDVALHRQIVAREYARAMLDLPEIQRAAFILHKADGLSVTEVAKALAISPSTAKRYIVKAWTHCSDRLARLDAENRQ